MISPVIIPIVFLAVIILMLLGYNRTLITLVGAVISSIVLMIDAIPFNNIIEFMVGNTPDYKNLSTIVLIFGILIITSICNDSGVFSFISLKIIQKSHGYKYIMLVLLCILAFAISFMLNNILSMIILIPLTITTCRILMINPIPYLIVQMIVANTGCLVFMISSFSNVLIAAAAPWSFNQFFFNVGLFSFLLFAIVVIYFSLMYKTRLETPQKRLIDMLEQYNAWLFVKSRRLFYMSLCTLIATIALFVLLPNFGVKLDIIAITAGMLLLIATGKNIDSFLKKLDFQLIIYLLGIFLIVGAIEFEGVLNPIAAGLKTLTAGNPLSTSLVILWLTAGISSGTDNIPLAKILIPITQNLTTGFTATDKNMVFSAFVYGIHLGDNFLPQGDNIIVALQLIKTYEQKVPIKEFLRIGPLISVIQLTAVSLFLMALSNYQIFLYVLIFIFACFIVIVVISQYRHQTSKLLGKNFLIP